MSNAKRAKKGTDTPSNFAVGVQSNDRINMPNIDRIVTEEVERLTREMIADIRDISIYSTVINYQSIDYIPESDPDIPQDTNFIVDEFNSVIDQIQTALDRGNPTSANYDFAKYLEMFQIRYNGVTGQPEITVVLEFSGLGFDDLDINQVLITRST